VAVIWNFRIIFSGSLPYKNLAKSVKRFMEYMVSMEKEIKMAD
jgi:hypothetical protein